MDMSKLNLTGKGIAASALLKEAAELLDARAQVDKIASEAAFDALAAAGMAPAGATKTAFVTKMATDANAPLQLITKLASDLKARDTKIAALSASPSAIGRPDGGVKIASALSEKEDLDARWEAHFGGKQ